MTNSTATIGSKYDAKLTTVEICKLIRKELKALGYTAKVIKRSYSSISVQVKPLENVEENNQWNAIKEIVDQYRYDDSDAMTDYFNFNYYASIAIRETFY